MRRKSEKEIKKDNLLFLIVGCASFVTAFFILLLPLIPTTPYEEYREKEIIISKIGHSYGGRSGTSYDYIVTDDGEKFNITGKYDRMNVSDILTKGTFVTIKYDTNRIFPFLKYAEEITLDGNIIVAYDNDKPIRWGFPLIFSIMCCIVGTGFLSAYRFFIIRNKKLQTQRTAQIIKKYGKHQK